LTRVLGIFL